LAVSKKMEMEKPDTMIDKNKNKRTYTIKRYRYLFALLTLLLVGCSEPSSMLSPNNNVNTNEPNWISLPSVTKDANGMSVMSMPIFQASKSIDGKTGGKIKINGKYAGGPFGEVNVQAELNFLKDAFSGAKYITMIVDTEWGYATFSPSSVFDKDATYNAVFIGLDLSGVDPTNVKFAYLAADGTVEYALNDGITIDLSTGTLGVKNAMIPHFSRYGFIR